MLHSRMRVPARMQPSRPVPATLVPCKACRSNRSTSSAVFPAEETPSSQSAALGIVTTLIGQEMLRLDSSCNVVPLLDPVQHQIPFAAALHIYHPAAAASSRHTSHAAGSSLPSVPINSTRHGSLQSSVAAAAHLLPLTQTTAPAEEAYTKPLQQQPQQQHSSLVELLYVLSGSGYFTTTEGVTQRVSAGDSVIAVQQEVKCSAGTPPTLQQQQQGAANAVAQAAAAAARDAPGDAADDGAAAAAWWNLVPWLQLPQLPQVLHQQQQLQKQHDQQQLPQQEQLVLLQLLLPSELLTGELQSHHVGHYQAVAQQLPWSNLQATGSIDQQSVCELLVGAQQLSQPQQQHKHEQDKQQVQQQQQQARHLEQQQRDLQQLAAAEQQQDTRSSNSSSSSSSCTLPPLSQHQVLKRGLSEVRAFQLPAQTNRLALLFGPHASPAVCLSFGVEVFDPGHVTPLHIHNSAHELFFVLAGRGVGVHGPGGRERVEMTAGDVAVFPPGVLHGIDNTSQQQLYCLQMMLPNESFVEWVQSGEAAGVLDVAALQRLAAAASCG